MKLKPNIKRSDLLELRMLRRVIVESALVAQRTQTAKHPQPCR